MGQFRKIATLRVQHDFYESGVMRGFELVPTPQTLQIMKGHRLRARKIQGGLQLFYEQQSGAETPIISFENLPLLFEMNIQDPLEFLHITDLKPWQVDYPTASILYYNTDERPRESAFHRIYAKELLYTFPVRTGDGLNGSLYVRNDAGQDVLSLEEEVSPDPTGGFQVPLDLSQNPEGFYLFTSVAGGSEKEEKILINDDLARFSPLGLVALQLNVGMANPEPIAFESKRKRWRYFVTQQKTTDLGNDEPKLQVVKAKIDILKGELEPFHGGYSPIFATARVSFPADFHSGGSLSINEHEFELKAPPNDEDVSIILDRLLRLIEDHGDVKYQAVRDENDLVFKSSIPGRVGNDLKISHSFEGNGDRVLLSGKTFIGGAGVAASVQLTFVEIANMTGGTLKIGRVSLEAGADFEIGGAPDSAAENFAEAVNDQEALAFVAVATDAVVTLYWKLPGIEGNSVPVQYENAQAPNGIAISAETFLGGEDPDSEEFINGRETFILTSMREIKYSEKPLNIKLTSTNVVPVVTVEMLPNPILSTIPKPDFVPIYVNI